MNIMNTNMEKVALGSDVVISAVESAARIPIIYGNDNTTSINISVENQDATEIRTITFPLSEGQTLSKNDYIFSDGLHIGDDIIEFTTEQREVYKDYLQGIILYPNYTRIYSTDTNPVSMKVYYYSITGKDNQIYVTDKNEQLIAVFNRDDDNTLINPRVQKTQNSESIFTFSIDLNNPKWKEINNPENLYWVDGMVFSTNFDGSFEETISSTDEKLMSITAYERQKLLSRKYVRAWNSITGLQKIDTFMVVILSGGTEALVNNGEYVNSSHQQGESGYVLDALLYGTGWTTGTCNAGLYRQEAGDYKNERVFDFETDQLDIYENIMKVQELWGGIIVFDSVNKIVHHYDETLWLPYSGYEVKYRKNMQSLNKVYNNKIITRLCPLGESGLNIKEAVIDDEGTKYGSEWIENFEYTDTVLEGIENNADITDPTQLKKWGERKLKDLCKPSKELTVDVVLLYQTDGYELETIDLNDIVDVINYNNVEGETEQLRVVNFEYGVWDKSDAVVELSDITLDSTDIFKKSVKATNSINNGTLDSSKVVVYYKNGQSVSEAIRQTDIEIESTKSDLIKTNESLEGVITKYVENIDPLTEQVKSYVKTIEDFKATIEGLTNELTTKGGYNLIRNSVGYFGDEYWEGNAVGRQDTDIMVNNEADSGFILQNGSIVQELSNIKNGNYTISFNYKKLKSAATIKVKISGVNEVTEVKEEKTSTSGGTTGEATEGNTETTESNTEGGTLETTTVVDTTQTSTTVKEDDSKYITLSKETWTRVEQTFKVTNNYFRIEFNSNADDAALISDLILNQGIVRMIWSQNQDETMTDTVSIGKGIKVSNSAMRVYTKIDADGNRIYGTNADGSIDTTQLITEMTDEGVVSKAIRVKEDAKINDLLIIKVNDQVWLTGIEDD